MKRAITAAILVPLVTWVVLWSSSLVLTLVTALVAALCFSEYRSMAAVQGMEFPLSAGLAAGLVMLTASAWALPALPAVAAAVVLVLALRSPDIRTVLPTSAAFVFGVAYIFGSWRCAIELHALNRHLLFFALALNWVGDVAAFAVGSRIGRHKLALRVSPGKSWEGSAASLAVSCLFGALYLSRFLPAMPEWEAVGLSAAANVAGQIGDLCESAIKRGAGLKDSGSSLPGHGGWMDRVDSSMFALPAVYLWIAWRAQL
jgi:phosphatidate cytidylyltransferase